MTSSKYRKTYSNHDVVDQITQTQNLKNIFYSKLQDFTSLEDLNRSLAQSAGELRLAKSALRGQIIPFV